MAKRADDRERDVTVPMMVALALLVIGHGWLGERIAALQSKLVSGQSQAPPAPTDLRTGLIGWGAVYVTLLVIAETSAARIAVAFAWLLVFTELVAWGPEIAGSLTTALGTGHALDVLGPSGPNPLNTPQTNPGPNPAGTGQHHQ